MEANRQVSITTEQAPELDSALDGPIQLPCGDLEFWASCDDGELVELAGSPSGAGYVLTADCMLAARHGWLSC